MSTETDLRFQRSQTAILTAARDLLQEQGPASVSHAQVAERAGVARATVYRHWPRSDQLLAEAMASVPMPFLDQPTAPTRDWLKRELASIAEQLELADVRAVATTLANSAQWDQVMDTRREQFASTLGGRLTEALKAAQKRGELTTTLSSHQAAALLIGPIYYRSTIERATADPELIEAAIAALGTWSTT